MWKTLKKYLPRRDSLEQEGKLRWLGKHLYHPELWQFHCHAVAKGTAFGLLAAFIPLPGQTVAAALLAYLGRANLPISIVLTWVSNPFTFVPINYGIYKVGKWLTGDTLPYYPLTEFDWQDTSISEAAVHIWHWLSSFGKPFLVGSIVVASTFAVIGYLLVQSIWKLARFVQRDRL